eukprot:175835_1
MLTQYQKQLIKDRDEILRKLEWKYMHYIQLLLSQKMLITAKIRERYDELLSRRKAIKHTPISSISLTNSNSVSSAHYISPISSISSTNSTCSLSDISPSTVPNIQPQTNCAFTQPPMNSIDSKLFHSHMSLTEASKLRIKQPIDHRDMEGRFLGAIIIDKNASNLKIHYIGWTEQWDVWCDYTMELFRFAKYKSISERPRNRFFHLQKGNKININPMNKGWKVCQIISFDAGQVEVAYFDEISNFEHYYWSHIDNENEVTILTGMNYNLSNKFSKYKFNCLYCTKIYKCHSDLVNHMQNIHSEKQYVCSFCPYANAFGMKRHERQHTNDEEYKCNLCVTLFGCNTSFLSVSALTSHVNSIHKKSNHKKSKRGHKRKLDDKCKEKDEREFSCSYCRKKFDRKHLQLSHERHVHEEDADDCSS